MQYMHASYAFTCRYKVVLVIAHQKESPSESFAAPAYERSQAMPICYILITFTLCY
jgi:hypothetical protein